MRSVFPYVAAAAACAGAVPADAALPPNYQRAAEFAAIAGSADVAGAFDQPIARIEYLRPDVYRVTAGRCRMDAAIVDRPATPGRPGMVGPRQFDVRAGRRVCR